MKIENTRMSLYQRVLAARFSQLPTEIQRMHGPIDDVRLVTGECTVESAKSWLGRFMAYLTRLPHSDGVFPVKVQFTELDGREKWERWFGSHHMVSTQWQNASQLMERVGVVKFTFDVSVENSELSLHIRRMSVLGVPLPRRLFPKIIAREFARDARFHFDVGAWMPGVGLLVRYQGYLIE